MALSHVTYVAPGAVTDFTITFDYITQDYVKVYLDGILQTVTADYTYFNATTIRFNVAPLSGEVVAIQRNTENTTRLVDFVDAGNLTEADLDLSATQSFHMAQESIDGFDDLAMKLVGTVWDADNFRIANLADPVSDQDAATKIWVNTGMDSKVAEAAASAAEALVSENEADAAAILTAADVLTTDANATATAADAVSTAADAVSTAADAAATAADAIATAADAVSTASDAASASADSDDAAANAVLVAGIYDDFDDRYLGSKASDPALDNDGDPLLTGAIYWNTTSGVLKVYDGAAWQTSSVSPATHYTKTELDGGQLDNRYYTETESDNKYAALAAANTFTAVQTIDGDALFLKHMPASDASTSLIGQYYYKANGTTIQFASAYQPSTESWYLWDGPNSKAVIDVSLGADALALSAGSITYGGAPLAKTSANNTFTIGQTISSGTPFLDLKETDTTDEDFRMQVAAGRWYVTNISDSGSGLSHKIIVDHAAPELQLLPNEIEYEGGQLQPTVGLVTHNAAYTIVRDDYRWILYHSSGSHTWTIPPDSSVNFPVGTKLQICNAVGTLTIARGTGVALSSIGGGGFVGDANKTVASGNNVELLKWAGNNWFVLHHGGVT